MVAFEEEGGPPLEDDEVEDALLEEVNEEQALMESFFESPSPRASNYSMGPRGRLWLMGKMPWGLGKQVMKAMHKGEGGEGHNEQGGLPFKEAWGR